MSTAPILLQQPLKFLVVDDSRAIQAIIRRAILRCGYEPVEVRTALDGEQALEMMDSYQPDLVVTDWHMPKVSGLELLQALRQMGQTKVRVGFITTEKTPALLDQAISSGAMFILPKPFEDAELVAVVTAAVKDLADALTVPSARPAATAPVAAADQPVTPEALQAQLQTHLGKIPFRLVHHERITMETLTPTNLLGLYMASGRKGVYAIGVLDANAVCIIGGGGARKAPPEVRAAMASGQPDEAMLARANDFLGLAAQCLTQTVSGDAAQVTLAKASVVKNTFAKLAEVLVQPNLRSDFRISIPGYGEGRLAFFVVAT